MRSIILFTAAAALATAAFAQTEQDHAAHHPEYASAPAAGAKRAPPAAKAATGASAKAAAPQTSAGKGASKGMEGGQGNMKDMHDQMHKPGGMHDQMHGQDGGMMDHGKVPKPPAPAGSK
jgi:hypothetical protein